MKHSVPHDLGQARAKQAAEAAMAAYTQKFAKYRPETTWTSASRASIAFHVKGMTLSGSLEVLERTIDLELEVPFLLRPFKSQAIHVIEGEIREWIDKARSGAI